ncbi:hypothetical protein THRCLA_05237 [Thraustotheca clavata]|uniref:Uncharacterized protein n=1 Tax=Thraustotheca clavata TaxID=74557 RepID=A0A1V9ZWJ5_9STRA|nr:hypothetical protein THRCLA_05237 [Thraustotheca clavata]
MSVDYRLTMQEIHNTIPHILVPAMENMWLDELCDVLEYPLAKAAIAGGHVQFLNYLVTTVSFEIAAHRGHLEMVKYLHFNSKVTNAELTMCCAAENGHLNIIKLLHENRTERCNNGAEGNAIQNGHVEVLKYLKSYGLANSDEFCMDYAHGLEMIKYLHYGRGIEHTIGVMSKAASKGDLESVIYLNEHSAQGCTSEAMDGAAASAYNGHLEVVKYLHENRTEGCTNYAIADQGHLAIIQYLYENRDEGCTTDAMDNAAENGHLDVVMLLHDFGEECSHEAIDKAAEYAMDAAAENGHFDVVEFLHDNLTEGCTTQAMDAAAGHLILSSIYMNIERKLASPKQWIRQLKMAI